MPEIEPREPSKIVFEQFSLEDYIRNPEAVKAANDAAFQYFQTVLDENDQLYMDLKVQARLLLIVNESMRTKWKAQLLQAVLGVLVGQLPSPVA